jgi:hypothetical protein
MSLLRQKKGHTRLRGGQERLPVADKVSLEGHLMGVLGGCWGMGRKGTQVKDSF